MKPSLGLSMRAILHVNHSTTILKAHIFLNVFKDIAWWPAAQIRYILAKDSVNAATASVEKSTRTIRFSMELRFSRKALFILRCAWEFASAAVRVA